MPPNAAAVIVLALGAVVVAEIPDVKGASEAAEAPAKATGWLVAVGTGEAVVFEGLSTLFLRSVSKSANPSAKLKQEKRWRGRESKGKRRRCVLINNMHNPICDNLWCHTSELR
jgi:hypothetical protein